MEHVRDCPNPDCSGGEIITDMQNGHRICKSCYTIVESNLLVSEISFGETSGGRAMANGTFVSNASTGKGAGGRFPSTESSERVLANGSKGIHNFAAKMRLPGRIADGASRIFNLAVNVRFNRGRPAAMVWASCLYLQCRLSKTSHMMLIDFSEELQINVFELGSTYLRLRKLIPLPQNQQVDIIDPSIYITRFASLLEFGDDMTKVAADAMRLVRRFRDDWIVEGRRPAGICGACLVLAARMNNYRRSIEEVVQVVKIAEITVRKRLDEFSQTATGQMSVADFMKADLESMEKAEAPPIYIEQRRKEKLKEEETALKAEEDARSRGGTAESSTPRKRIKISQERHAPAKSSPAVSRATSQSEDREDFTKAMNEVDENEDAEATEATSSRMANLKRRAEVAATPRAEEISKKKKDSDELERALEDEQATARLVADVQKTFGSRTADEVLQELSAIEAAQKKRETGALEKHNDFADLDDEELEEYYKMDEEESATKARVWVTMNKDYLAALSKRQQKETEDAQYAATQPVKRKRRAPAPQHKGPHATTGEAMKALVTNNRKFSSRLNFAALGELSKFDSQKKTKVMPKVPEAAAPEPKQEPVVTTPVLDPDSDDEDVEVAQYDPNEVPDLPDENEEVDDEEEEDEE